MNIVDVKSCPACGNHVVPILNEDHDGIVFGSGYRSDVIIKMCSGHCVRTGVDRFIDAIIGHNTPVAPVHFHVRCDRCGFVWLAPVPREEEVKKAW